MTKPPFPYYGGKTRLAPWIASLLPPHRHYVEPFAGSLAVLLAKPRAPHETINDLDGDLVTFWRVLRDRPDDLIAACALTPHSRAEQELAYDRPEQLDDLERARRVWVHLSQGRGGLLRRTGWRHYSHPDSRTSMPAKLAAYVQRMPPAALRLLGVSLECRDALDIIARFGAHEDVLIYADPPYLGDTRGYGNNYRHDMRTPAEHEKLAEALHAARAAVMLSGYPSPQYDGLYGEWQRVEFAAVSGNGGRVRSRRRTEVVWSNRPIYIQPELAEIRA